MTPSAAPTIRAGAARRGAPRPGGRRRGLLHQRRVIWLIRVLTFVAVIAIWQLWAEGVNRALFAPPTEVAQAFVTQITQEPTLFGPLLLSLEAFAIGMTLGVLVGLPTGLLIGRYRPVEFVVDPWVTFLYVIPSVAFVPLFVLWFGFDFQFEVVMVFESTLFPMMINAAAGAKNVESDLIDGGRSFGASEFQIMRTIVIPASMPFVFAGLRISFSSAWVGVVVAQMTGALAGLGGMILMFATTYKTANMLVPIFVIMFVGVIIHALTGRLMVRMTPWHQSGPEAEGG
jgi:ABC-type nitrate/sulfonate/bicarbonate transport system permease component